MSRATEESIDLGIIQDLGGPAANSPLLVDFKTAATLIGVGVGTPAMAELLGVSTRQTWNMHQTGALEPLPVKVGERRL
jgi:hypothetical protein